MENTKNARYNANDILSNLFGWGYLETQFLLEELDAYEVDLEDVTDDLESFETETKTPNGMIWATYRVAVQEVIEEVIDDIEDTELTCDQQGILQEAILENVDFSINSIASGMSVTTILKNIGYTVNGIRYGMTTDDGSDVNVHNRTELKDAIRKLANKIIPAI